MGDTYLIRYSRTSNDKRLKNSKGFNSLIEAYDFLERNEYPYWSITTDDSRRMVGGRLGSFGNTEPGRVIWANHTLNLGEKLEVDRLKSYDKLRGLGLDYKDIKEILDG